MKARMKVRAAASAASSRFLLIKPTRACLPPVGGTSAVAPLWAGLFACINQGLGKPVGFVNPLLYALPTGGPLHDITAGTNGDYSAAVGWDPCTGLGTPDGQLLLNALT